MRPSEIGGWRPRTHRWWPLVAALAVSLLAGCRGDTSGAGDDDPSSSGPATAAAGVAEGPGLYYEVVGDGEQTVVVAMGFALRPAFEARPEILSGRRFVFYDPHNRGRSPAATDLARLSVAADAEDLERLREHLGIESMTIIGASDYGKMAVLYALEHPDRVERIVQLGPTAREQRRVYPAHLQATDRVEAMGREAMIEVQKLQAAGFHASNPREYCDREWEVTRRALVIDPEDALRLADPCVHEREWPIHLYVHFEQHRSGGALVEPLPAHLAELETPVLTIHGRRDRTAPYGAGRQWAVELGEARLLSLDDAAHATWVEEPDAVFDAIGTFLDGQWPSGAEAIDRIDPLVDPDAEV